MRYLFYYPMIHVLSESYVRKRAEHERVEIHDEVIGELVRIVDNIWEEFRDFLKTIPKFDRVYIESTYECGKISQTISRNIGMGGCLTEIVNSGAKIEVTEDTRFKSLKECSNNISESIYVQFQKEREQGVYKRINDTLRDNERGLLLFGCFHQTQFEKLFRRSNNIVFEVYDNSKNVGNILSYLERSLV